jgi:hypothetical protein
MVQGVRAGPILVINTPKGKTMIETEFSYKYSGIYKQTELLTPTREYYSAEVMEDEHVAATEIVSIDTRSHILFTYDSNNKALRVSSGSMPVPEPSTMILFGSFLLLGIIGVRKGEKPS